MDNNLRIRQCQGEETTWSLTLDDSWSSSLGYLSLRRRFGVSFVDKFFDILVKEHDHEEAHPFQVSWLEVVFWVSNHLGRDCWPLPDPTHPGCWADADSLPPAALHSPTLAAALRLLRTLMRCADADLSLGLVYCSNLDLLAMSVSAPQTGLLFRIRRSSLLEAAWALQSFCAGRPIRTTNDLSRSL